MRIIVCLSLVLAACGGNNGGGDDESPDAADIPATTDPLHGLPTGVDQWNALCAKNYGDMISQKFCAGSAPPTINSLKQLQQLLGLAVVPNPNFDPSLNPNVRITMTGHSTGLGLRHVSPINPRAFLFTTPNTSSPNQNYQIMAFSRGEPFVELVANDRQANTLRFFLVRFHPACESAAGGCTMADLLTPTIEANWTNYTIYDDATIANTTLDCNACHQPGGPGTRKLLRMQELRHPWRHWFYIEDPINMATILDFQTAHGTEDYAGIPMVNVQPSRPIGLERIVANNGFANQPNAFDTDAITNELMATGASPTWNQLYARAVAGLEIAPPYHSVQTDPAKIAAMTTAYRETMAGTRPRDQMPDIRDTFRDDVLADMSIRPKAGLDGRGILVHICSSCHNSRLDQTQSRAQFNVEAFATMSRAEKDKAIERLMLPDHDIRKMPPVRFHELSDAERTLAIEALRQ
jgi:hypothetical protein